MIVKMFFYLASYMFMFLWDAIDVFPGRFLSELKSPGGPKLLEALGKFI